MKYNSSTLNQRSLIVKSLKMIRFKTSYLLKFIDKLGKIKKSNTKLIVNLLGEDKECYRLRDDYLLGSFGNTSTFSSPLKK